MHLSKTEIAFQLKPHILHIFITLLSYHYYDYLLQTVFELTAQEYLTHHLSKMLPVDALSNYLLVFNICICKITCHDSLIHHLTRTTLAMSMKFGLYFCYIL